MRRVGAKGAHEHPATRGLNPPSSCTERRIEARRLGRGRRCSCAAICVRDAACPSRRIGHLLFCVALHRRRPTHAATAMLVVLLLLATTTDATDAKKRRRMVTLDPSEDVDHPNRPPTKKEAADSRSLLRPLSQNAAVADAHNHMQQSRMPSRRGQFKRLQNVGPAVHSSRAVSAIQSAPIVPHKPDPLTQYAALVAAARKIQHKNVVIMAAADWDFRLIVSNWHHHLRSHGYHNNLVLSMDTDLHIPQPPTHTIGRQ